MPIFPKEFMLPPLNFSTSTIIVTIGMWQLTILIGPKAYFSMRFLGSLVPPMFVVISALASPVGLFLQFCPCIWRIVLWGALVASDASFGWPVVFWNFMEFLLSWRIWVVCLKIECLQTIMSSFELLKGVF